MKYNALLEIVTCMIVAMMAGINIGSVLKMLVFSVEEQVCYR